MTNDEVVKAFMNDNIGHSLNLTSTGDKLISYSTCIIQKNGDGFIINDTHYSITTAKHTNRIKRYCLQYYPCITVDGIPEGTKDLMRYAK